MRPHVSATAWPGAKLGVLCLRVLGTKSQQSLFSWAEFMAEEPVKPKGRSRKAQPATSSLFDWALSLEQEREAVPVGAGR